MNTSQTSSAIPDAGPDFEHLLAQDVVIEGGTGDAPTGAQALAPDHSPRAPVPSATDVPRAGLVVGNDLQREVEQLLYLQAELLDRKLWQAWMDLFDERGIYWMPVMPEQTEWEGSPSIFAEDKLMMEIRKGRVSHPNAWSQAPMWETNHIVGNVAIESADGNAIQVRSRFPHDGAAPRRRAAFRRHLPAHAGARCRRCAAHRAAAGRSLQRPGAVRLRAAGLGVATSSAARSCS
ncbi:aromatic-ring-hydroxylating dioxygenase subunit beta [Variovorax ureilyticus]|uniref:aromatic-ring-hydroxylating dioxygenase subunit beta n=1 Tax=Variovorax ureilyticus TaxID=1836198 RepID=UPI003D667278